MAETVFTDHAKEMAKGKITIPKEVRDVLGVGTGDSVTFIVNNGEVKGINSAVYAMKLLQDNMTGEAEKAGIKNDQDVFDLVKSIRHED